MGDRRWLGGTQLVVAKASLLGGDRSQMRKWPSRSSGQAGPPASLPLDGFFLLPPLFWVHHSSDHILQQFPLHRGSNGAPGNLQRTWPWSPFCSHLLPSLLVHLVQGLWPSFFLSIWPSSFHLRSFVCPVAPSHSLLMTDSLWLFRTQVKHHLF